MNEAIAGSLPIIMRVIVLLISVSFHEFSHAVAAYVQGDRTPRDQGRLTLNPIAHLDPIGSLLVPGLLVLMKAPFLIGWAKPVVFNAYNLKNRRWGPLIVALAGPFSNFLLFVCAGLALKILVPIYSFENLGMIFLLDMVIINIVLGFFNLIPIPPLDGSSLFEFLPQSLNSVKEFIHQNGLFIFIGLILLDGYFHFLSRMISFVFIFATDLFQIPLPL